MRKLVAAISVGGLACLLGLLVWRATGSVTAGYVIGVVSLALAAAGLVFAWPPGRRSATRSTVNVERASQASITGVRRKTASDEVESTVKAVDVDGGDVTGVRED